MASDSLLHSKLENARRDLLDLTTRNRLLNTARRSLRSGRLEIVDELSQEVFRHLVLDKKPMGFLPAKDSEEVEEEEREGETGFLFQPEDDEVDETGLPARHTDDWLQTQLASEGLQKRLLRLFYDARTFEEEQGVNILYLALGFLKWYEADHADRERHAPLLLIPVALDRRSANARFRLRYTDDDIATNLSLQERLKIDFGIDLRDVPDAEDLSPNDYFEAVSKAISNQRRWEVLPNDIVLWFFSFSKFLMYRDLDPETWPEDRKLEQHCLIRALLQDGLRDEPPLCGEEENIDAVLDPMDMVHVLDADSSQTLAIEEVKLGRNLVIQGPPGTGKSQTIANLIAAAIKEGKTVLFVAEKMAALEVVKRRLDNIGLGDMCLELHSNKANKRVVLQDLARTLDLGRPAMEDVARHVEQLRLCRDRLNRHCQLIHTRTSPSEVTPYQILGQLVRLRAAGVAPADFQLESPLAWSRQEFREKLNLLGDLVAHIQEIGNPQAHPWRGVELEMALPTDIDRLSGLIPGIVGRLDRLMRTTGQLAEALRLPPPATARETATLARLAQRLVAAPAVDRRALGGSVWEQHREQIDSLVQTGQTFVDCRRRLEGIVAELGWTADVTQARQALAAYGRSWFRVLRPAYRNAQATLRGLVVDVPPRPLKARLEILDTLIRGQKAQAFLGSDEANDLGQRAFGTLWNGVDSDWASLAAICTWEGECRSADIPEDFRRVMAGLEDTAMLAELLRQIAGDFKPGLEEIRGLFKSLKLNTQAAFEVAGFSLVPLADLKARLKVWKAEAEAIPPWIAYYVRRRRVEAEGMSQLAARLDRGAVAAEAAVSCCQMAYYEQWMREVFRRSPELAQFNGMSHEQLLGKFRQLDIARIQLARYEVASAHHAGLPVGGSDVGEVGLVRREIQKKRRHLPLRRLLSEAGRAVQAIKPVFMMSPISVAQYLSPGTIDFDLLLVDEASQVRPVDALGAVARVNQVAVVGDDRQLPPTTFFSRVAGDDVSEEAEAEEFQAGDIESILGLCCAQNMSQRMLRWHYRSRHHSLIAVSNHEFYSDKLYVVPSPSDTSFGQGVFFHYVQDGLFDRGKSATNRVEARVVADAVMAHARDFPEKTLGVGAFSVSQRDTILDELELRRREDPSQEQFFATSNPEPFFVKNLENIQGDERDVIFISVGYGKDESGYMTMNFGPLSNEGGERRLNVLITRSRERCEVFSSIASGDIDLSRTRSRGAEALKTFLNYAQTGELEVGTASGRDPDSEFESEVGKAIEAYGYRVVPQVGVAGFYIDLAVVDPEMPGRYLIGIECDGANYHRSRSARDRDRLRQQVLEDRGWIIHRIWSTDWFYRPEDQLRKTLAAIEAAKVEWAGRAHGESPRCTQPAVEQVEIARQDGNENQCQRGGCCDVRPYVVASFRISTSREIHEVSASELARVVEKIVEIEGPVHREEVARRVTQLWGLQRTGSRIRDAVSQALEVATRSLGILRNGEFYSLPGQTEVAVRDRGEVSCTTVRRPEMIPPAEIRKAVSAIVEVHLGVSRDEAVIEAARLFGFRSTSSQLRGVIERQVDFMVREQTLEERNGKLYASGTA